MTSHPEPPREGTRGIRVNGEARALRAGTTLAELLRELGLGGRRVAVAVNREVVPRASYESRTIAADDRIEILEAVGGG
jgi:thiamine biosynthesis protein ThiS